MKFHDAETCETCLIPPDCEDGRAARIELNLNSGGQCLLLSIRFSIGLTYIAGRLTGEKQELASVGFAWAGQRLNLKLHNDKSAPVKNDRF